MDAWSSAPTDPGRRDFLKAVGAGLGVAGGILVLLGPEDSPGRELQSGRPPGVGDATDDLAAWLHVGADGRVTVYTGKVELGQNIRTSLAQQVAEELRLTLDAVTLVMADTALVPWDAGTFGSRTTPMMGLQLRRAAAAARELLVELAARRWGTDPSLLVASGGVVANHAAGERLSYGALAGGERLVRRIGRPRLTPPTFWAVAGTRAPKVAGRDFVTGRHRFASDLTAPEMVYGKVLRPAGFGARLVSLDATGAQQQDRTVGVVRQGEFVGVTARDPWTAEVALGALRAEWSVPPHPSHRQLAEDLRRSGERSGAQFSHTAGSVSEAFASAERTLEATYTVEFIAHVPLEPRAAIAEWKEGALTVWTATQRPFSVRDELADGMRVLPEKVRVIVPPGGAAYGGKHTADAALEAARLAKAAGSPVKVVWTREEEFTWAYFRPAGLIEVRSAARSDGTLAAWEFRNVNSGPAGIRTPYAVPHQQIEFRPVPAPLRQGSYRALAATANHFAREVHMDELAHALGMDPLAFRLKNLEDPRLRAVFAAAAERAGWPGRVARGGRAWGLAGGVEKGGYVATCAEVEVRPEGRVRVRRVVQAFDCGAVVNPNGLRNQIEGAIVQGLGGALFEAVRYENGRVLNPCLSSYRVPRFSDLPALDVLLLDRKDVPSAGAGETPIVGVAPAVANAFFAATGVRLRDLPLVPEGLARAPNRTEGS